MFFDDEYGDSWFDGPGGTYNDLFNGPNDIYSPGDNESRDQYTGGLSDFYRNVIVGVIGNTVYDLGKTGIEYTRDYGISYNGQVDMNLYLNQIGDNIKSDPDFYNHGGD